MMQKPISCSDAPRDRTMVLTALLLSLLLPALPLSLSAQEQEAMEPQFPQQQTAGDLLRACAASRMTAAGRERRRYCHGFVSGVEEVVRLQHSGGTSSPGFCTPSTVTASMLAEAFVRYGASHKGEIRDPAAAVVRHALVEAYPCQAAEE